MIKKGTNQIVQKVFAHNQKRFSTEMLKACHHIVLTTVDTRNTVIP